MVGSPDKIHLLHIDDDPSLGELLRDFFESTFDGFAVTTATEPETGLEIFDTEPIDCIVCDFEMPSMNGLEVLEKVRDRDPQFPFILFTGKGSEEIASEAISKGVTDYLQKKPGLDQYQLLANRVENYVAKTEAEEEIQRTKEWFSTLLANISDYVFVVDPDGAIIYCSPSVEDMMGYTPSEIMGTNAFENTHPEDVEAALEAFTAVLEQPEHDVTLKFRAQHKDGSWRLLEVRGRNLLRDSLIEGIVVSARDVTDRPMTAVPQRH